MLCSSYYCLYSLFNKIRDKGRTVSARRGVGGRREKWPKHCMHIGINEKIK
jgi:hypothetical protein